MDCRSLQRVCVGPTAANQPITSAGTSTPVNLDNVTNLSKVCRLCTTITDLVIPIFFGEGEQNKLADKIHQHLPIKVSKTDELPTVVCCQCASTLLAWHELVKCSVQAEQALKAKIAVMQQSTKKEAKTMMVLNFPQPSSSTEEDSRSKLLYHTVKTVLDNYFHDLHMENTDIEFVCQKCTEKPALTTIESLTEHLKYDHSTDINNEIAIKNYIKDYITFEEVLLSGDSDRDEPFELENSHVTPLPNVFCPFCTNAFSSPTRLMHHINKHFEVSIEDGVICCDVMYKHKKSFVQHLQDAHVKVKIDETTKVCKSCGFTTDDATELQAHINDVHQLKKMPKEKKQQSPRNQKYIPAVCPECNKTFSNKYAMYTHLKSHSTGVSKYSCDKCDKSYKNQSSLSSHCRVAHKGVLNFLCSECGEAFPTRTARDVHSRLHTGAKPYKCERCKKSFRAKNTLDRHLEIHLNIRKYQCMICEKRFRKKTHLDYHIKTHSKIKTRE